jgi:RNA polymerase sigma-70 factor (ECF subfamily)
VNDDALAPYRKKLFGIAYRMLGSAADAEDVLQDAWMRLRDQRGIDNVEAWLVRAVSRLCIDRLKSARARRETYVGPWLPEPITTSEDVDRETISLAFLAMLERLTPMQRAVFLLRQVFELDYAEIAGSLGVAEAAVRQTFHRAKDHVASEKSRFAPTREAHKRLLMAFVAACQAGDLDGLRAILAADAVGVTDGGGRVRAARNVLHGADAIARFFVGIVRKGVVEGLAYEVRDVNGWPAVILWQGSTAQSVLAIDTDGAQVFAVRVVSNPDKLGRLAAGAQATAIGATGARG